MTEDGSQDHRTRALPLPLVAAVLAVAILAAAAIAYRSDPRNPAASLRDEPPVALVDIPPGPTAGVRIVEREVAQALTTSVRISLPGVSPGRLLPNAAFGVTIGDRFLTPVVEPLTTAPRSVAIVIDTEGQDLAANRQAAANGVTELLAQLPRNSRVALLDARGGVLAPLTADLSTLVHAASGAARTDGAPRSEAVDNALKETTRKAAGDRAAIVLVGSSLLEHARPTVTNLAQDARAMDAPVYSIGRSRQTVPAVRQLINASGGYMQVVSDSAPLESFDGVAADLVNQYRVTFRDSMHGSDPVTLRVNGVGSVPVT